MLKVHSKQKTASTGDLPQPAKSSTRAFIKCRSLLGMKIYSQDNEYLGDVVDLVLESVGGAIAFVLFRYRDKNKFFIVPYASVAFGDDHDLLFINSSKSVFENSPGIVSFEEHR